MISLKIREGGNHGLKLKFGSRSDNEMVLGSWEAMMQNVYSRYLQNGQVVYDLGAHQGFLAMLACRLVGDSGSVEAFEPLPSNFALLNENIEMNCLVNCRAHQAAVSNAAGKVRFTTSFADVSNTYVNKSVAYANATTEEMNAVSLDELLKAGSIPKPDFIKIDVEGAELDVLHGARDLLRDQSPLVCLETHNIHNPGVDENCILFMKDLGYSVREKLFEGKDRRICSYILTKP